MGREVADRIDFIHGLNALLFDKVTKKKMLERRQLHRILANETWVFGEEWSLTGDDERLHTDRPSVVRRREMDAEYHAAKAEAEGKPRDPKQSWRAMPDEGDDW